jgi:hypothetical protein
MRAVVSFEEAVACVDAASPRLGTERVRLHEAIGRVLAEDVRANTAWASSRRRTSTTISLYPNRASSGRRSAAFGRCWPSRRLARR